MSSPIKATITRCRHGQALLELSGGPFNGVAFRPGELRQIAQQLTALADMAARLPTGGKHWRPTQVVIDQANTEVST